MSKKSLGLLLIGLFIVSIALVGCGGKTSAPAATADGKSTTITRGGVLNATQGAKWSSLDPTVSSGKGNDKFVINQLFETLIEMDMSGKLVPGLAESWELKDGNKTVILKLKKGVKFHDGTDFNAAAVKFVLERVLKPDTKATSRVDIEDIASIDVVDDYTVKLNLKNPSVVILSALTNYAGYMISPTAIQKYGKDIVRNPVGTGPFKMKEAVEGDHITMVRFDQYHTMGKDGKPLPYIDEIVVKIIPDDSVKLVNLRSGSLDLLDSVQTMNIRTLSQSKDFAVAAAGARGYKVMLNVLNEPFSKKEVRQAIAYAVDREEFVKVIADGYGTVEPYIGIKNQWFYDPTQRYSYNIEKAKELLTKAGYPNGFKTKLSFTSREPDKTVVQLLQAQLKKVGIEIELEAFDRLAFNDKWYKGQGEMGQNFASIPKPDPYIQYQIYHGTKALFNFTGYSNKDYDKALEDSKTEFDTEKRKALLKKAQEIYLDDSAEIFLFQMPLYQAYNKKLQDFKTDPDGAWASLKDAWIKK